MRFLWLWLGLAAAQSAAPDNSSSFEATNANNTIILAVNRGDGEYVTFNILPLVSAAVDDLPHALDSDTGLNGYLAMVSPQTSSNISSQYIAYTSCDSSDYSTGLLSLSSIISTELSTQVSAIVFYSLKEPYCNISGDYNGYQWLYTMTDLDDSYYIYEGLPNYVTPLSELCQTNIFTQTAWKNFLPSGNPPGTAVAMIILYVITGLITLTFLSIIITGAIRAHRHPERYGTRDFLGRPTQSRARGLARAILDTIPIVKFGERLAPKGGDLELSGTGGVVDRQQSQELMANGAARSSVETPLPEAKAPLADGHYTETAEGSNSPVGVNGTTDHDAEEGLGCSICTDDFERGQDIRVLPCNHKFHPACVDPWLLDVSGTCPLCRVDLRPTGSDANGSASNGSASVEGATSDTAHAAPVDNVGGRRRIAVRRLFAGVRNLSAEDRIEALRRFRREDVMRDATIAQTGAPPTVAHQTEGTADLQNRTGRLRTLIDRVERRVTYF